MDEQALPKREDQQKRPPLQRWRNGVLATLSSDWQGTRVLCYGLLLAMVGIVLVAAYYINHPGVNTISDTTGYLRVAQRILDGGTPADVVRTPGYPLFIDLFGGPGHLEMVSIAQGALFILTALEMYLLAWLIWKRAWISLLVGLIVVSDMYLLSYAKPIISEGLMLWLTASLALAAVWYVQRVSARRLWLAAFFLLWLFMTRPEWVYLPVALLAYLLYVAARRKRFCHLLPHVLIAAVVLYGLLGLFIYANTVEYGFTGITRLQSANLVGKILQYNMQDEAPPQYADVMQHVDAFLASPQGQGRNPNLLAVAYPQIGANNWALGGSYALAIVKAHPFEYLWKSVPEIVILPTGYAAYSQIDTNALFGWLLYQLLRLSRALYFVEWMFLAWAIGWLALLCWRRTWRLPAVEAMAAVLLIAFYQVFLDSLGAYVDLRRFRAPLEPVIILVIWGSLLWSLAYAWQRYKTRNNKTLAPLVEQKATLETTAEQTST